jgi:hypothetical protein
LHTSCEDKSNGVKDSCYEELGHVFDHFPGYDIKILWGDLNVQVGREDILKPTVGNESSHEITSDNGVRIVNFVTSKNLAVKSIMFLHHNIHKYTWTSPDCCTGHYLVVTKVMEGLVVSK